jgi:hypothetical protein
MNHKKLIKRDRLIEYLNNIEREIQDIKSIPVANKEFFLDKKNSIQIKAIKYILNVIIK